MEYVDGEKRDLRDGNTMSVRVQRDGRPHSWVPLVTVTLTERQKVYPDIVYLKDFLVVKEPYLQQGLKE